MKVVVFTTVYPNDARPVHGLFVEQRALHAAAAADVVVVSPVPWQVRRKTPAVPFETVRRGLDVLHPTFWYVPGLFKSLDWLLLGLSAIPALRRLRKRCDFDLIDAHFGYPDGVAAAFLGWWFRRPVAITFRGSELVMAGYRLRRLAMRFAMRRAAHVIAVSRQLASLAEKLGAPASRIHVVPNGINTAAWPRITKSAARDQLGIAPDTQLIVSVGHVTAVKRFHKIIEALPRAIASAPAIRLAIVGDTPPGAAAYRRQLDSQIRGLGLQDRVVFTGLLEPSGVAAWLAAADLFVLASEREGSPNAVYEALACGRPVVATNVGDLEDLLTPAAGILVPVACEAGTLAASISSALARTWDEAAIRSVAAARTWHRVGHETVAVWTSPADPAFAAASETERHA